MNEYSIFFNGSSWTCEVSSLDPIEEVVCHSTGITPMEALENGIKAELYEFKEMEKIKEKNYEA